MCISLHYSNRQASSADDLFTGKSVARTEVTPCVAQSITITSAFKMVSGDDSLFGSSPMPNRCKFMCQECDSDREMCSNVVVPVMPQW